MKDVSYLTKDDTVSTGGGSYKAISEEKVTSVIRESLIRHGIVIVPISQIHTRTDESLADKYGNPKISRLSTVDTQYRIQNIDDPNDYIIASSSGTGVDTQDKGVGKAMTYSYKYLLLRTFAIPTGEDPDKISSDVYTANLTAPKPMSTKDWDASVKEINSAPQEKGIELVEAAIKKFGSREAALAPIKDICKAFNVKKLSDIDTQLALKAIESYGN